MLVRGKPGQLGRAGLVGSYGDDGAQQFDGRVLLQRAERQVPRTFADTETGEPVTAGDENEALFGAGQQRTYLGAVAALSSTRSSLRPATWERNAAAMSSLSAATAVGGVPKARRNRSSTCHGVTGTCGSWPWRSAYSWPSGKLSWAPRAQCSAREVLPTPRGTGDHQNPGAGGAVAGSAGHHTVQRAALGGSVDESVDACG